ncbi:META domain-containing protein [Jiangella sp. DSM 45060]|uniref:META domain-containing protein n=1 Tax=Jiangella sp. DSM 45060 TaxID=1798224 RepID=UPI00087BD7EA|nr:META domain-containing protein [Jiangella sp. DSM 45060]SDT67193.1 Heat shock protein HslJ [Jiangella sp. DSM 45060]
MAGIALLAACGGNDSGDDTTAVPGDSGADGSTEPAVPVVGSRWVLEELQAAGATIAGPADPQAYFEIDENGDVTGSTGCNGFSGSAEVSDSSITFQPLISTRRGCSGDLGQIDGSMLGVLSGEVTVEMSGDVLTITNAEGETLTMQASDAPSTDL